MYKGVVCEMWSDNSWPWNCTMCDFHNFVLINAGQMHRLPQRLKSTLFEFFSSLGAALLKKLQKTLILIFEANIVTSLNCIFWIFSPLCMPMHEFKNLNRNRSRPLMKYEKSHLRQTARRAEQESFAFSQKIIDFELETHWWKQTEKNNSIRALWILYT